MNFYNKATQTFSAYLFFKIYFSLAVTRLDPDLTAYMLGHCPLGGMTTNIYSTLLDIAADTSTQWLS